jgi:hypothetical protein
VARARIEAIWAEERSLATDCAGILGRYRLLLELTGLLLLLGEISESEAQQKTNEFREVIAKMIEASENTHALNADPTLVQQVMSDFADRLAARQGTFMPDFDALYRRKAELDGHS